MMFIGTTKDWPRCGTISGLNFSAADLQWMWFQFVWTKHAKTHLGKNCNDGFERILTLCGLNCWDSGRSKSKIIPVMNQTVFFFYHANKKMCVSVKKSDNTCFTNQCDILCVALINSHCCWRILALFNEEKKTFCMFSSFCPHTLWHSPTNQWEIQEVHQNSCDDQKKA